MRTVSGGRRGGMGGGGPGLTGIYSGKWCPCSKKRLCGEKDPVYKAKCGQKLTKDINNVSLTRNSPSLSILANVLETVSAIESRQFLKSFRIGAQYRPRFGSAFEAPNEDVLFGEEDAETSVLAFFVFLETAFRLFSASSSKDFSNA